MLRRIRSLSHTAAARTRSLSDGAKSMASRVMRSPERLARKARESLPVRRPSAASANSEAKLWFLRSAVLAVVCIGLVVSDSRKRVRRAPPKVISCRAQHRRGFGRAAPGAVLSDAGGCVNASALDAGVCVEDASSRWLGGRAVRCLPSLAVIGAMKSGTTNVMLYLAQHPKLRTSENAIGWPMESRYFSAAADPVRAARGWRQYLALYPATDAAAPTLTFDKSPNYLVNPTIAPVLAALAPSLKLVVMLRDPTKRAYSHFQHECRNGRLREDGRGGVYRSSCAPGRKSCGDSRKLSYPCPPAAFRKLVDAQISRAPADRCAWARGPDGKGDSNVLPRGLYACQLAPWLAVYDRAQLLALVFEEFLASRAATLAAVAAVEDFMGLRRFDYAGSARVAAVERLYAAVPSRGGAYSPMDAATKKTLDDLYCEPNADLSRVLARPLPWNCGDPS
mmetsp:Transcript_14401/g.43005  ORF Transcript_14401/g.43005 Transcript_14401/m.43005 type:complete len:451 (-) Transcript_14401:31-1383(-)